MKPRHLNHKRMLKSALMCVCLVASSLSMLIAGPTAQPARAASPNGLVINEVFESQTALNEYFELYNTSATTINLSTYEIYNKDGSVPFTNLDNPTIAPNEFRVITPAQLHSPTICGASCGSGGLAQSNDFLGLVNTSPSDTVIDVVNWGGSPNPGWTNYQRFRDYFFKSNPPNMPPSDEARSLQRWPDGKDTDQGADWDKIQRSPDAPSCADPYEGTTNDNSLASAVPHEVDPNTVYLHRLCPANDSDFFSFSVSSSLTYTVRITPTAGSQVNAILRIFDPNGGQIAQDNNTSNPGAIIVFKPASNGTYKAQVVNSGGNPSAGAAWLYNVNISSSGSDSSATASPTANNTDCNDQFEPDDQLSQARGIALNTEQVHILCKPATPPAGGYVSDTDWLVVSASSGKVYSFITKNLAGPVDTIISLHASNGDKLAENDDAVPGQGLGSRIDYTFGATGAYFLRIRDKSGASAPGYRYTVSFESTGQLPPTGTATASSTPNPFSPTPTPGKCYDEFEPDGVMETAKLMYIGSTQHHSICPVGDADWVRFYARPGKVYTIRTLNLGIGVDTYMWVFDSDGKILGYDDDGGGEGVSSRIDFYPQADAFYFVQIKNAGDLGGPDQTYDISLAVAPGVPQPPGTATFVVAPVVTVTAQGDTVPTTVVQPTQQTAPTSPPLSSPTRQGTEPTPALNEPTAALPPPQSTQQPTVGRPVPTTTREVVPTVEEEATPGDVIVPGVPGTGSGDSRVIVLPTRVTQKAPAVIQAPQNAQPQQLGTDYAPVLFRVFYDRNLNDIFDTGEGIRGLNVYFVGKDARNIALGSLVTEEGGSGRTTLPKNEQRIVIPYLGIDMPLTNFPEREQHSIWLPKVSLPQQVP